MGGAGTEELPAEREAAEGQRSERADGHREDEGQAGFVHSRAVLLDAVDTVEAALELAQRRRPRDETADDPNDQGAVAVLDRGRVGLDHGGRQDLTGGSGAGASDGGFDVGAQAPLLRDA